MGKQIRATMHNGRTRADGKAYSPKHNDRSFDVSKAPHIDPNSVKPNDYIIITPEGEMIAKPSISFEEHERAVYAQLFTQSLDAQNARYTERRQYDRVKSMDDYRTAARTCPEETIFQLGTKDNHASSDAMVSALANWIIVMKEHFGSNFKMLDCAIHYDEATPHAHLRGVWIAEGKDGLEVSQSKALKALGIERPDMEKPQNKYNNPKMTFTQQARELWLACARKQGLEIIEEPEQPGKASLTKEEYIHRQVQNEMEQMEEKNARLQQENKRLEQQRESLRIEVKALREEKSRLQRWADNMRNALSRLFGSLSTLMAFDGRSALDHVFDEASGVAHAFNEPESDELDLDEI